MMSAYSAVSLGHSHPRILSRLMEQAKQLAMCSRAYHTSLLAPFAEKLTDLAGLDMMLPMNTGAEAVETAVKAARLWGYSVKKIPENQAEIIVAEGNFHGRTTTIVSFSTEEDYRKNFGPFTPGFKSTPSVTCRRSKPPSRRILVRSSLNLFRAKRASKHRRQAS
jgi:ornithine--oxo-acid transaminase